MFCSIPQQDQAKLKEEYRKRRSKLKSNDVDGHYDLALWCERVGLKREYRSELKFILREDPDHELTRARLGYARWEGKWVLKSKLPALKKKKEEADLKARGFIKYKGEWVHKDDIPFLKKGLFKIDGRWVTKDVKKKLDKGWIFFEGELYPPEAAEKIKAGLFPVDGAWVKESQADAYHSKWERAWFITTKLFNLRTNLKRHEVLEQVLPEAEKAYKRMKIIFHGVEPREKLLLFYIRTLGEYNEYGQGAGGQSSLYGAYYNVEATGEPAVILHDERRARFYIGYAVGRSYLDKVRAKDAEVPEWFAVALAGYNDRFHNKRDRVWLCKNSPYITEGLKDYRSLFERFNPDALDADSFIAQMSQLGLLVACMIDGGKPEFTKLFQEAIEAILSGKDLAKKMKAITKQAANFDKEVAKFIQKS